MSDRYPPCWPRSSAQPKEVYHLIIQKLNAAAEHQPQPTDPRSKPLGILFSYAIRQERHGETGLFDAVLHFVKASFGRYSVGTSFLEIMGLEPLIHASPRAIILATPHLHSWDEPYSLVRDLIPKWVAAVSVASHTEEVAGYVVDALLQFAARPPLQTFIPAGVWLWLNVLPPLPSELNNRLARWDRNVFWTVRGLNNVRVLTSYLTLVWPMYSNGGLAEMEMSVREDFRGIGAGCHRAGVIQRVDYVLGRSGWGAGDHRRHRYEELTRILQEMNQEATKILSRMFHSFIFLSLLTLMGLDRIPLDVHVCSASLVTII